MFINHNYKIKSLANIGCKILAITALYKSLMNFIIVNNLRGCVKQTQKSFVFINKILAKILISKKQELELDKTAKEVTTFSSKILLTQYEHYKTINKFKIFFSLIIAFLLTSSFNSLIRAKLLVVKQLVQISLFYRQKLTIKKDLIRDVVITCHKKYLTIILLKFNYNNKNNNSKIIVTANITLILFLRNIFSKIIKILKSLKLFSYREELLYIVINSMLFVQTINSIFRNISNFLKNKNVFLKV